MKRLFMPSVSKIEAAYDLQLPEAPYARSTYWINCRVRRSY